MKLRTNMFFLVLLGFLLSPVPAGALDQTSYSVSPARKSTGAKWRIGYVEGGGYMSYLLNLQAIVKSLADLGWIKIDSLPAADQEKDCRQFWQWLSSRVDSDFIEFVGDGYWSSNWKESARKENRRKMIARLKEAKDIDIMLAMGTWAGQDMATDEHAVATVVIDSNDPVRSNIVKGIYDSGYDHVTALIDPRRYSRQIRMFHDIVGFKRLGMAYEMDTVAGRSYAAVEDIKKMAGEIGFEVVSCNAPDHNVTDKEAENLIRSCYRKLAADNIDALYVTTHLGITLPHMKETMQPLYEKSIPTFSQEGAIEVRHGVMMSMAPPDFNEVGKFHAEKIAKICNGARPRNLDQVYEDKTSKIAINLEAARRTGWEPPIAVLGAAEEVFEKIAAMEE